MGALFLCFLCPSLGQLLFKLFTTQKYYITFTEGEVKLIIWLIIWLIFHHFSCSIIMNKSRICHCGKTQEEFSTKKIFQEHIKSHDEKDLTCDSCQKTYKRKSSLINHVRSHHSDINFPCDECGKRFKRKDLLQYHHKIHEAVKITCSHCDTSFSTKKTLNEKKFHSTGQIYQCKECFKSFSSKIFWINICCSVSLQLIM